MIKINLASKKQSSLVAADAKGGAGASKGLNLNLDQFKELPLRKLLLPLVAVFLGNYVLDDFKDQEIRKLVAQQNKLSQTQSALQQKVNKVRGFEKLKKPLEQDEFTLKTKIDTIRKLVAERDNSHGMFRSISEAIPGDVWLTRFNIDKGRLSIKGESLGINQVSDFMAKLRQNAFFQAVNLASTNQSQDRSGLKLATFELKGDRRKEGK